METIYTYRTKDLPGVAGFPVDVELEVLVVDEEATSLLVDGEVGVVLLRKHVHVVTVCELSPHLHHLVTDLGLADRVDVGPVACKHTTAQYQSSLVHLLATETRTHLSGRAS